MNNLTFVKVWPCLCVFVYP